jgi:release factor glutamine methyltransferase
MRTADVMRAQPATPAVEIPSLRSALQVGALALAQAGIENPRLDAEVLLCQVLELERDGLFLRFGESLSAGEEKRFKELLERRGAREPLAYITGHKEFWSLDFKVAPAVLIPRPETELLVEIILDQARERRDGWPARILDVGTGSGAIAVTLAKHLPHAEVWALDISGAALQIGEVNARRHEVEKRMRFLRGDLFEPLGGAAMFDVIVSNPPYVRTGELAELAPEIRQWEPVRALDGGVDGLDYYARIIAAAAHHMSDGAKLFVEIGSDMAESVAGLLARADCYLPAAIYRDYAGRDRVIEAMKGLVRG